MIGVNQTSMSPRIPTITSFGVATYNSFVTYNYPIGYNASTIGSAGSMSDRGVPSAGMAGRVGATASMGEREIVGSSMGSRSVGSSSMSAR